MGESFFVDPASGTATAIADEPRMGYVKRTCFDCHSEWTLGQSDCLKCHSSAFTEEVVPAIPFMSRVAERLKPKKPVPRATPAHKAALRAIGATVTNVLNDLRSLDGQLREAVIDDVAELQPAQGLLNRVFSITGDRSLATVDGLGIGLESLIVYLNLYLEQLGDTP